MSSRSPEPIESGARSALTSRAARGVRQTDVRGSDRSTCTAHGVLARQPVAMADFAELARKAQLGAVCITDHDTIEGGLRLREMDTGLQVIVGEEITTGRRRAGRSLPQEECRRGSPPIAVSISSTSRAGSRTCRIRSVSKPPPDLRRLTLELVAPKLDIVEVFNAREVASSSNVRALEFARRTISLEAWGVIHTDR